MNPNEPIQEAVSFKNTNTLQVFLSIWIAGVIILYLLLYPPAFITKAVEVLGLSTHLASLQHEIRPFFQTTDFSTFMMNQ